MFRTAVTLSPFNCRWIAVTFSGENVEMRTPYAICMRDGSHVVSEHECLNCPHWQPRLSTKPHAFRGIDDETLQ